MSRSAWSRLALIVVTAWGLTMALPSFYRLVWPLASFGLTVDNDGVVVDTSGPFDAGGDRSPASAMGLVVGDRLDLRQMNCWKPHAPACAALITMLGGSAGVQGSFVGREVDFVLRPRAGEERGRIVHLRAQPAPLDLPGRLVLLADTLVGILSMLAAAWLVWVRPGWMTWGFFFYFFWFNPGQTYTYYAILQSRPLLLFANQCLVALATGAAFAGLLIFAMRFPDAEPDPRWRRWEWVTLWVGVVIGALTLLANANLFGVPTERITAAGLICGFAIDAAVLALLLVRRRTLHPRNEQRMRWVIAGCAIGLPSFIFAEIWEMTGLMQSAWGLVPSETVLGLLYLVQGVLAYFVWTAVRRQRVISVAIPLRHGTITAALALALAVPVMFLHERITEMHPTLHLPHWLWPLVLAPLSLLMLQRVHETAVDLADHAFSRTYHRARRGFERAGRIFLEAEGSATIDRSLAEEPVRWLQLTSAAVFRYVEGTLRRTEPAIGWAHASLQQLRPEFDGPVMECLTRRKPVRLVPQQWRGDFLPGEDQAPCLAVPIFGLAGQAKAIALFGPHVTGSDITRDEYEMLQTLAVQAGRGYDRVEIETLRRELRDLRTQLHTSPKASPPLTER